jgi:DnaK suppressor protein
MNATVTKAAKKSSAGSANKKTSAAKVPVKSGSSSASKAKSTTKAVADKIAKTKATKAAPGTTKAVAGKVIPATKSAKSASATKATAKAAAPKAKPSTADKGSGKTSKELKQAIERKAAAGSKPKPPAAPAASGKPKTQSTQSVKPSDQGRVRDELAHIEKAAVSKASEVATKTTKSTTVIATDGVLSEAQILKMSDKDYMNAAQLAFFKARLQQLEKDLLKNAGETTEHLRETVLVPDPADRATIEEEHALELRTRDRERKLLKKVQQSIASIDSGEYGWCEETGEPIGIPRLLARPTATLSLEAQQRRELKQKLYGD